MLQIQNQLFFSLCSERGKGVEQIHDEITTIA
jgi:hypothetical protein